MAYDIDRELQKLLAPPSAQVPVMPRLLRFLRSSRKLGIPRVVPSQQLQSKRATRGLGFMGGRAPRRKYPFLGEV
jgi:hypothetical protein